MRKKILLKFGFSTSFRIHYNSGSLFISKPLTCADQQVFAFLLNIWLWQSLLLIRFTISFIFIVIYFCFVNMLHTTKCDWSKIFVMYIKRLKNICRNLSYFGTHSNIITNLNYTFPRDSHLREVMGKEYEKHLLHLYQNVIWQEFWIYTLTTLTAILASMTSHTLIMLHGYYVSEGISIEILVS